MTVDNPLLRIPSRYWGYLTLSTWGAIVLMLLRHDAYSLDEGGAKALLFAWSISDQVASSVVTFGAPDLRILLFMPIGFLWTGSIVAAKIFTILSLAVAAWVLYQWQRERTDAEVALLSTGLLLLSPLALVQIDTLSPGVYLLPAFALGVWMNSKYRADPKHFGGWYFALMFVCALTTSLHPAGLAFPIALLWSWHKEPLDRKQQKYFFIGASTVTLLTLIVRTGWSDLIWLQNPLDSLATILLGPAQSHEDISLARWIAGAIVMGALAIVALKQYSKLWNDFTGRVLLIGLLLGGVTFDSSWAVIALSIVLYFGTPLLLHRQPSATSFARQRGGVMALLIALLVMFTRSDRAHFDAGQLGILPVQEQLIKALADEAASAREAAEELGTRTGHLRVASQWPSRTMIACKCDTLPLPPATQDPESQLAMLRSISHLIFDPQNPDNMLLSRNLAPLGGTSIETLALHNGGALLHLKATKE